MLSLLVATGLFTAAPHLQAMQQQRAGALVKQLGDSSFRKREAAAKEILAMGGSARQALEAAFKSSDPEIRERSRRLYPEVQLVDIRRQIKRILDDKTGTAEIDLPGWKSFEKSLGSDRENRAFYLEVFQKNIDLLLYVESDPKKARTLCGSRCFETQMALQAQWQRPRGPGQPTVQIQIEFHEFAALMMVSMDEKVYKARPRSRQPNGMEESEFDQYPISSFMTEDYFKDYLTSHAQAPIFKKLFLQWLETQARFQSNGFGYELYYAFEAIKSTKLKEAIGFVEKIVKDGKLKDQNIRSQAIICLGLIGEKKHMALLEPLLKDKTQISSFNIGRNGNNKPYTTQVRDVALGMLIHMHGEKPSEYGFEGMNVFGSRDGSYEYYSFSFTEDETRKKTFQKWEDYLKKSNEKKKDDPKPVDPKDDKKPIEKK